VFQVVAGILLLLSVPLAHLIIFVIVIISAVIFKANGVISLAFIKDKLNQKLLIITGCILIALSIASHNNGTSSLQAFVVLTISGVALLVLGKIGMDVEHSTENLAIRNVFDIIFLMAFITGIIIEFRFLLFLPGYL